jgi:predicted permease
MRRITSSPALVTASVLTLALAIGINVAMVGLVYRAFLSPPSLVANPDRLASLAFEQGQGDERVRMTTTSWVTFAAIREQVTAFSGVAAWQRTSQGVVVNGEQARADVMLVSGGYFAVLGAPARLGRGILENDDRVASEPVAVLGHAFWRSTFGGDPRVIGQRVGVTGVAYTIVGVMPPRFTGHSPANVDVWIPFAQAMRGSPGWEHEPFIRFLDILGRLSPAANAAMASGQAGIASERHVLLQPLAGADVNATDRRVAYWLAGVSSLVFTVGLANAATLLLVRAARRRREFAIRAALGASTGRLLRELVVEALAVSLAASLLSLLLASWFDAAIRRLLLPGVAPADGLTVASVLTALGAGALAAIVATVANALNLGGWGSCAALDDALRPARRRPVVQAALLVLQTALSVMLLAGAGLFGRSLFKLLAQDFGMNMDRVVLVDFETGPGFVAGQDELYRTALDRVRTLPGVREATVIRTPPFAGFTVPPIAVPGRPGPPNVDQQLPYLHAATPEFLDILGIRIVEGRGLTAADEHAPVVVVNESMARGVWPGESPIGKCIRVGFDPDFDPTTATGPPIPSAKVPCREVVGVAHDMRQRSVVPAGSEDKLMQYFVPFSQVPVPPFIPHPGPQIGGLMLKADVDAAALAPAIRRIVMDGRSDLPFVRVRPYSALLEPQMRPWTLGTWLLGLFSVLAVAVAAVGLYAAFSHAVVVRRREMAIRLAIGAPPTRVLGMILRESLTLGLAGICCGAIAAAIGARYLRSLLYDTRPADPLVLGSAAAVMLVVAVAATLMPARRASRVDPATLLRVDY